MTSELAALNVISEYISDHNGYIPLNPNKLVSYSCSRYDLQTLNYLQAKNIIIIYQKNVDRLRSRKIKYVTDPVKKIKSAKLSFGRLSFPKYCNDVDGHSESDDIDIDIEDILGENIKSIANMTNITNNTNIRNRQLTPSTNDIDFDDDTNNNYDDIPDIISLYISQHKGESPPIPSELVHFSCNRLLYTEAQHIIDIYNKNKNKNSKPNHYDLYPSLSNNSNNEETAIINKEERSHNITINDDKMITNIMRKCRRTTKIDCMVFNIWLLLMTAILFGVSFGLIHIGYGINKLKESSLITHEICLITNYTKTTECEYQYIVQSVSKCGFNHTLYRKEEERFNEECGIKQYDVNMNISCFVGDCNKNEYSLLGFDDLTFSAKSDIELGSIVLIVTTVPFISFVCWVYFCYQCGAK